MFSVEHEIYQDTWLLYSVVSTVLGGGIVYYLEVRGSLMNKAASVGL
jgi:hypothetical protein